MGWSFSNRAAGVGIATALLWVASAPPSAAIEYKNVTVKDSKCVIVVQSDEYSNPSIDNFKCPSDKKQYVVKYVWMNDLQISMLLAGYVDENGVPIIGKSPHVLHNQVYRQISDIYDRFGAHLSSNSKAFAGHSRFFVDPGTQGEQVEGDLAVPVSDFPLEVRRKLRVLPTEGYLIWPDMDMLRTLREQRQWPDTYDQRYLIDFNFPYDSPRTAVKGISGAVMAPDQTDAFTGLTLSQLLSACLRYHRFIGRDEFQNYWNVVAEMENFLKAESDNGDPDSPFFDKSYLFDSSADQYTGTDDLRYSITFNPLYDYLAYLTEASWPDDFLAIIGSVTDFSGPGCGDLPGGLDLRGVPRKLYAQFAVIEPLNDSVVVSSVSGTSDAQLALRPDLDYTADVDLPTGDVVLDKSEDSTLVIPLRIELRYEEEPFDRDLGDPDYIDFGYLLGRDIGPALMPVFKRYANQQVRFRRCYTSEQYVDDQYVTNYECDTLFELPLGAFKAADSPVQFEDTYFFGPALKLESITVDGKAEDIREAPQVALYTSGEWQYGSCPFLYFVMADGTEEFYGRVLVGETDRANPGHDKITLPEGVAKIVIREIEPEIATIVDVSFASETRPLATPAALPEFSLRPLEQVELDVPEGAETIALTGFYTPLTRSPAVGN